MIQSSTYFHWSCLCGLLFFTSTYSLVTCLIPLYVEPALSVFSLFPHSLYVCRLFINIASSLLEFLWDFRIQLVVWQVSIPPTRDVFFPPLPTLSTFLPCPWASLEAGSYCSKGLTDWRRSLVLRTFINMNSLQQINYPS